MDNTDGTSASTSPLFAMSGDGVDDIKIPMVFLFMKESKQLMEVKWSKVFNVLLINMLCT